MTRDTRRAVQVVDDHPAVAFGLAGRLGGDKWSFLEPVRTVDDIAVDAAPLVICDIHLAGASRSGPAAIRYVADELQLPVIAMTGYVGPTAIANAVGAGASAFVSKSVPFTSHIWTDSVIAVLGGHRYISPDLAAALLQDQALRPLMEGEELPDEAASYLHSVLREAGSRLMARPSAAAVSHAAAMHATIWRVARRRWQAYRLPLSKRQRDAATLFRRGATMKQAAQVFNIGEQTLGKQLDELRKQFRDSPYLGRTRSPLYQVDRTALLLFLDDLQAEEDGRHPSFRRVEDDNNGPPPLDA